jgi:hypothetical protein
VGFVADPATGVLVFATDPTTGFGAWFQVGGTSVGTPAWAAIIAIADQGRAIAGKSSLDGGTQTLPTLYSLPSTDFHKTGTVTTTGLGTPNGASLVSDLAASTITIPLGGSNSIRARSRHALAKRAAVATAEATSHQGIDHHIVDRALRDLAREAFRR